MYGKHTKVFLDIETGGLQLHHPIIQVGAVAVDGNWQEVCAQEWKIAFAESDCDLEALRLNSYNLNTWEAQAKSEAVVVDELRRFLNRYAVIEMISKRSGKPYMVTQVGGHNASFDLDRLSALFTRHRAFFPIAWNRVLDTLQGSIWFFERTREEPPRDFRLETLARFFGFIEPTGDGLAETANLHDALYDVRLTVQLARALTERSMHNDNVVST